MKKILKNVFLFLFLCLATLYFSDKVYALPGWGTHNQQICIYVGWANQNKMLKVSYALGTGKKVKGKEGLITAEDVYGSINNGPAGCFCSGAKDKCQKPDPKSVSGFSCKDDYKFKVEDQNASCTIGERNSDGSYTFYMCPDPSSDDYNVVKYMTAGKNGNDGMSTTYNAATGKYVVKFAVPDNYVNKIVGKQVRKVLQDGTSTFDIDTKSGLPNFGAETASYTGQELKNGISFDPGTDYYLVFYVSDPTSICNNTRLGYFQSVVPSTVPNPYYNSNQCISIRNRYSQTSIEAQMVSQCYSEQVLFTELSGLGELITSEINELSYIQSQITNGTTSTDNSEFTCQFDLTYDRSPAGLLDPTKNTNAINKTDIIAKKTNWLKEGGMTYWNALCTETYRLEYDDPKPTEAGGGFGYKTRLVVERVCNPIKLSEPKYYPPCQFGITCWGGPANHHGEAGAGPSEEFDTCVQKCDGGKYTQSCIDTCYNEIYDKTSKSVNTKKTDSLVINEPNSNFLANANLELSAKQIAMNWGGLDVTLYDPAGNPRSSDCVIDSNHYSGCGVVCNGETWCISEHGIKFTYLNGCNANGEVGGTQCYEVYKGFPCYGLTYEEAISEYERKIAAANSEYSQIIDMMQNYTGKDSEEYQIQIIEDYDKQVNGSYNRKYTLYDNQNKENTIGQIETDTCTFKAGGQTQIAIYDGSNYSVREATRSRIPQMKSLSEYTLTRVLDLNVGTAYLNKNDGNDIKYNKKVTDTDPELDRDTKYFAGVKKYYTRLDTKVPLNNLDSWPYFNASNRNMSTASYNKNIKVVLKKLGTWDQWGSTIHCLYGVDPGISGCPDCDGPDSGGIRYIFRPIELTDVFPNDRNPRFNWTGVVDRTTNTATGAAKTASKSYYGTEIDPEMLTEVIQSKGSTIYQEDSGEVDYEFVITRENIKNIRDYNKNVSDYNRDGSRNYLDYNMECYKNIRGQEVCASRFLDNLNGNSGSNTDSNYVTYSIAGYSKERRRTIIGCNNTKNNGTECDVITH